MSANGSNKFLNIEDANLRVRSGSVHAQGMTIGGITVGTAHGLQSVTDTSNTTSNTLQFTNATTAFKATSNIELTSATKIIVDSNVVTEYTGLATTLKSVYDVPATTGTQLEVYYDAKDLENGAVTSVTDLSPNSNGGSAAGDPQVSNGAFVFDGSGDAIVSSGTSTSLDGNATFSISLWSKTNAVSSGQNALFMLGYWSTNKSSGLRIDASTGKYRFFTTNGVSKTSPTTALLNEWTHITLIHEGTSGYKFYVNGVFTDEITVDNDLSLDSNPRVGLGNYIDSSGTVTGTASYDGSIANFRLYSKALNADQVKELYDYQKDYFLGSKSQLTIYKGHLGVGVTEPSGQLELAGDERIQEYPPRALRQYTTHVEGHGVFTVRASAELNQTGDNDRAWKLFTKIADNSNFWTPTGGTTTYGYSSSDGYTTAYQETAGVQGHWVQLQLPYKIKLHSVKIAAGISTRQAKDATVFGSNDGGNTWTSVGGWTDNNVDDYSLVTFSMNNVGYYSLYRLVITRNGGNDATTLSELQFFGTPGPTTLDKGSLSLTRSLDVPRVSRYDVDTETPRPEKIVLDYDTTVNSSPTDISGKGNHGTFYGDADYSVADKAFKFDGQGASYIKGSSLSGLPTGNAIYSLVGWINVKPSLSVTATVIVYGSAWGVSTIASLSVSTSYQVQGGIGGDHIKSTNAVITPNTWHHVAAVKKTSTGVCNVDTIDLYVDGVLITDKTYVGISRTQNIGSTTYVGVGGGFTGAASDACDGLISNPKIYSVALEPSEVRKLYRLGRTGRSMVISDTAVGIGKVPEAQLDVRGTISFVEDSFEFYKETSASWYASLGFETLVQNPYNEYQGIWRINGDQSTTADRYLYTVPRNGILMVNVTMIHKVGEFRSGQTHHATYWCLRKSTDNGSTWDTSLTAELVGHRWVNTSNWNLEWRPVSMSYTGRVNAGDQVALFFQTDWANVNGTITGAATTEGCRMNGILI
jgi:hypothetical protein